MVENVLEKLCALFDAGQARYRVLHHPAGDRSSESVAKVRGTEVGQGAKALVCMAKGNGVKQYVLAVLPADKPILAIEAGTTALWHKYLHGHGDVLGIDTFGESAPASVLWKHFGFTPENAVQKVLALLAK